MKEPTYVLFFGDPKKGANFCVQISYKPNAIQRFFLRKLLNIYFVES